MPTHVLLREMEIEKWIRSAIHAGETSVKLRKMLISSVSGNVTKIVTKISKGESSYDFT